MADIDWGELMPPMGEPNPVPESNGVGEAPTGPCAGAGDTAKICDCLECALKPTNAAILSITDALNRRKEDACNVTDDCIDKIYDKIKRKIEGPLYSCEQCKSMIQNGMGGTLEYAVRCAAQKCDDCVDRCESEGQPINEGKCCKNCGSANCTCKNGKCVAVEEEEGGEYRGWCNRVTYQTLVLNKDDPPPGPDWSPGPLSKTESAALANIQSLCRKEEEEIDPGEKIPFPPTVNAGLIGCEIGRYIDNSAAQMLNASGVFANMAASTSSVWDSVSRLGLGEINIGNAANIAYGLVQTFTGIDGFMAKNVIPHLAAAFGCNNQNFTETFKAVASITQACKPLGIDPSPWMQQHFYTMNAACRTRHLTPDEAMAAFLADSSNRVNLDAHFAIAGLCNDAMVAKLQASRSKPIPMQLAMARRRELIDKAAYDKGMRELGYIDERNPELLFKLTEQIPPMSDIIRFMVRDSDDTDVVSRFGLDEGFTEKYRETLKDWSRDQGISEKHAQYAWRAHWRLPSPTALFTFYHRLRNNPKFGGPGQLLDDIRTALIQDDMLPRWIDHYLAVSFRPMRLVDIRRSFQIGSLSDAELVPAYQDLGYSDETAEKMSKFTRRLRDRAVISELAVKQWLRGSIDRAKAVQMLQADGIPLDVINKALEQAEPNFDKSVYARAFVRGDINRSQLTDALSVQGVSQSAINLIAEKLSYMLRSHPILDDYEAGLVDRTDAAQEMTGFGMNPRVASHAMDRIDHALKMQHIRACVAGIKRRFLTGELDISDAQNNLINRGMIPSRARETVDWWGCELKEGEREVSASQLCEWLSRGAITSHQFLERLTRIGYSDSDAALMLEDCLLRANAKVIAKEMREAKERAADQQRLQRAMSQAAKQQESYLQRLDANQKKAAKLRANREKSLLSAAKTLAQKCECDLYDALVEVKAEKNRAISQYGLSIDRSLQILNLAANSYSGGNFSEYRELVSEMAEAASTAGLDGIEERLSDQPSTNGATVPS